MALVALHHGWTPAMASSPGVPLAVLVASYVVLLLVSVHLFSEYYGTSETWNSPFASWRAHSRLATAAGVVLASVYVGG